MEQSFVALVLGVIGTVLGGIVAAQRLPALGFRCQGVIDPWVRKRHCLLLSLWPSKL